MKTKLVQLVPASAAFRILARRLFTAFIVLVTVCLWVYASADEQPIKASQEISLAAFGYQGLSSLSRFTTAHDLTINFLDHDHLLFTYNPKKLIQRHPECPPSHTDHVIDAKVLDLNSGKVVREKSWYVHDKHAYLWPIGRGRLLLRILNDLYVLDGDLNEKLLLESPQEILWTSVTPDCKQIILETAIEDRPQKNDQLKDSHRAKVKIEFLDVETLLVQRTLRLSGVVPLEGTSLGFGDAVRNMTGKIWLVRFGSNSRDRDNITRVRSQCVPNLLFPTNNTVLVGRCSADGQDYNLSAFTVTGHPLWRQRWTQNRYEPALQRSEDGSRVVISTIAGLLPGAEALSPDSEDNAWPRVEQKLHVLNAATGTSMLETAASVILSAQNYSLAPDGSRFAVVDGNSLRIFDLQAMSVDERAKYVAMQADAPTLLAPKVNDKEEQQAADQDDVFDVASASAPEQPSPSAPAASANSVTSSSPTPELSSTPGVAGNKASPTPAETDANVPTFRASSKVVVVDVVVTDSKGHPVKGLAQADFQIHEDGKPQRINYFHEHTGYAASDSNAHSVSNDEPKLPPNIFSNNQLAREDEPVTIFLLDLLNTAPADQHLALDQLIHFLKEKPKGAQFALCTLSNQLRLIQGFTPDEQTLIATALGKKGAVR